MPWCYHGCTNTQEGYKTIRAQSGTQPVRRLRWQRHLRAPAGEKPAWQCKVCISGSLFQHLQVKSTCTDCGGSGICQHKRERNKCKEYGDSSVCEHQRERSKCKRLWWQRPLRAPASEEHMQRLVVRRQHKSASTGREGVSVKTVSQQNLQAPAAQVLVQWLWGQGHVWAPSTGEWMQRLPKGPGQDSSKYDGKERLEEALIGIFRDKWPILFFWFWVWLFKGGPEPSILDDLCIGNVISKYFSKLRFGTNKIQPELKCLENIFLSFYASLLRARLWEHLGFPHYVDRVDSKNRNR